MKAQGRKQRTGSRILIWIFEGSFHPLQSSKCLSKAKLQRMKKHYAVYVLFTRLGGDSFEFMPPPAFAPAKTNRSKILLQLAVIFL